MPEYSSTTITPADGVQVPVMNGSNSGNFVLSALKSYILSGAGQANGLATLGADGKLTATQIPDSVKDIIVVASSALLPATGTAGKLYITADDNKGFRWDPDLTTPGYVLLFDPSVSADLAQLVSDLLDGTVTVKNAEKAQKDASGNVITTTYATKTELAAEETARQNAVAQEQSAREASDSNLQSQIVNINGEIDNIEALIGDEAEVENTDPSSGSLLAQSRLIHHANLLPNGEFGRVGARDVSFNQLIRFTLAELKTWNYLGTWNDNVYTLNNKTFTVDETNQTITVNGTAGSSQAEFRVTEMNPFKSAHKVWMRGTVGDVYVKFTNNIDGSFYDAGGGVIGTAYTNASSVIVISAGASATPSNVVIKAQITDLDVAGLASYTLAQLKAMFPANYPYDTGHIIPLNPTGFKVVEKNKIPPRATGTTTIRTVSFNVASDGQVTVNGTPSDGNLVDFAYSDFITLQAGQYFVTGTPTGGGGSTYRILVIGTGSTITENGSGTYFQLTQPTSIAVVIRVYGGYSASNLVFKPMIRPANSDATYEPYSEQTVLTPQIADGHYVNDSVYDYVENVVEDGIVKGKFHKRVGVYTFDGTEIWTKNSETCWTTQILADVIKSCPTTVKPNILCPIYAPVTGSGLYQGTEDGIGQNDVGVRVTDKSKMTGVTIYFELAEEEITYCEPLRSFGISDYSTVEPITPQDQLVNRIDVPFSVKTKSANTLIALINQNAADIAQEITDRQTADTSLLNKITDNSQRITNLEVALTGNVIQTTEDSSQKNVKTITSANEILPWAIMKRVGARSTLFNQKLTYGNFPNGQESSWSRNNGTIAFANGECTYTITAIAPNDYENRIYRSIGTPIQGHTYMLSGEVLAPNNNYFTLNCAGINVYTRPTPNSWTRLVGSGTPKNTNGNFFAFVDCTTNYVVGDVIKYRNLMIFDLTTMQEVSLTADQFVAKYPAKYYGYVAGSVFDIPPTSFEVTGFNKLETIIVDNTSSSYATVLRATGDLLPNTTYCLSFVGVAGNLLYPNERLFTTENIFTSTGSRQSLILTTQAVVSKDDTAQYNNGGWRLLKNANGNTVTADFTDVCMNITQADTTKPLHNGVYAPFSKTTIDTSFMQGKKYVNENCYDYSENVYVDGILRRKDQPQVGEVDVDDFSYLGGVSGGGLNWADVSVNTQSTVGGLSILPITTNGDTGWNSTTPIIFIGSTYIRIYGTFTSKSNLVSMYPNLKVYFKLATLPDPTYADPIPNFPCEDGTTVTAVTPQTDLVNAIDVPSTIAVATKISA